jgi:peptidoglycan/xylan/chitin deacetylase (PgdA/CDA1 family)
MDKLIEEYKNYLINDDNAGYGYPQGLKNKILKEVETNSFSIPVITVQKMIETIREEHKTGFTKQDLKNAFECGEIAGRFNDLTFDDWFNDSWAQYKIEPVYPRQSHEN